MGVKSNFQLNKTQKDILIGTILGDSGLKYRGRHCRLHVKHSINQLSLVEYKREVFKNITSMKINKFIQKVKGKDYGFAEFVTLTHSQFTEYHKIFYKEGKKIVPRSIKDMLKTPLSLAVWFMDDGAADYAGATLQTHCFSLQEVEIIRKTIKDNFSLETTKRKNKKKWIIYFPKSTMNSLKKIIQPYMLKQFYYKLIPYEIRWA